MKSSLILASLIIPLVNVHSAAISPNLNGKILLQVQSHGEAWYVYPKDQKRYYMRDGSIAYQMLRSFGLGITNADIAKIPVGFESRFQDVDTDSDGLSDQLEDALGTKKDIPDTDGDGYKDGEEVKNNYSPLGAAKLLYDQKLISNLKGRIVLQVQSHGEAWYIKPDDGKRYYMKDGDAAYQIMRFLSLGITNADLAKIPSGTLATPVVTKGVNCGKETQAEFTYTYSNGSIQSVDADTATKKAWDCFTTNLKTCTPAYLYPADSSFPPYQIQGVQGTSCVVSGPTIHPDSGDLVENRSCAIPTAYITFAYEQTMSQVPSATFYPGYAATNIVRNGGGTILYDNNTNETVYCQ